MADFLNVGVIVDEENRFKVGAGGGEFEELFAAEGLNVEAGGEIGEGVGGIDEACLADGVGDGADSIRRSGWYSPVMCWTNVGLEQKASMMRCDLAAVQRLAYIRLRIPIQYVLNK